MRNLEVKSEYNKQYYLKNKEKLKSYRKKYYEDNRERQLSIVKEWTKNNQDARKANLLRSNYGLSLEEYKQMLLDQGYRCAGCQIHQDDLPKVLHVDHCHTTGKVRGLLCYRCNSLLGFAKDNPDILRGLIAYLEKSQKDE